jgi:pimeloyl-ACP methyl ester carboxylesterase
MVAASGIQLHYTRTGGDKPPLVLAHGVTDDGLCWSPVAVDLATDYDVIMIDARGHGGSDAPDRGYGPDDQAEDLAGAISALGLERPTLLGHSMGAATALVLAGVYPDLPGAILLEDPPAWWMDAPATPDAAQHRADRRERAKRLKHLSRDERIAAQRGEQPAWSDAELDPWADAKERFDDHVLCVYDDDFGANVDWPAVLGRITAPALLITADPDHGAIVTAESAAALHELIPHLEIAQIADAGHSIRRDQPARYLEAVRGFLAARQQQAAD